MMKRLPWIRCPTDWILHDSLLPQFRWGKEGGAAHTAALMCLTAIVHETNQATGIARISYDKFASITEISRTSVSKGLTVLKEFELIETGDTQSEYKQTTFNPAQGWGKFPWLSLYRGNTIRCFEDFKLRSRIELDALKLMYLFVAMRDDNTNLATISYDRITERTGIARQHITSALGFLAVHRLVYVQQIRSDKNEYAVANTYRITGVDSHNHRGTRGRAEIEASQPTERQQLPWQGDTAA